MCLLYLKITIIHKSSQYQRWELNPHEHTLNRFSYHYGFHHLHILWSGLYLHHIFQFRCSPSSLYTFLFSKASLGITILQASPNLRNSTPKVSQWALKLYSSLSCLPFHHSGITHILTAFEGKLHLHK